MRLTTVIYVEKAQITNDCAQIQGFLCSIVRYWTGLRLETISLIEIDAQPKLSQLSHLVVRTGLDLI